MKRLIMLLACTALLAAAAAAQTPPAQAGGKVLQIHRFVWWEGSQPEVYPYGRPCDDCAYQLPATMNYRYEHRPGRGQFTASVVLKNVTAKPVKSVSLDFVFRDTATEQEFLTYHLRSERRIGPGQKKKVLHKIGRGKEPDNFSPAAPGAELLARTTSCGDGPLFRDRKSGELLRIRDSEKLLRLYPCYYLPVVTRIEYEDGTFWQP